MFAIFCRRRVRVPPKDCCFFVAQQIWVQENAVFVRSCSSSVCENTSEKESFTVSSYLINACGLSSNDALSVSKKLRFNFKSPEKPDAVLKLLREYGFTNAHISRIITGWPRVLLSCPNKTLLPKLQFFHSIGVPLPVLAQKLSAQPSVLTRSLENSLIPSYNVLKSLVGSDERVVHSFLRALCTFGRCCSDGIYSNVSMLRERGVPQSSIVALVMRHPSFLVIVKEKLAAYVDRAVEMGFDVSKSAFILAIQVFNDMTESTLKQKMEFYRGIGWSESEISVAFLKYPRCMTFSEKKITATIDFFVSEFGYKLAAIAECPRLLSYSLDNRIKPRCLIARILNDNGLKNMTSVYSFLDLSEKRFLKQYIVKYEKDIPELLDIYKGKAKSSPGP